MSRLLSSTRARLVLFQVLILGLAGLVTSYAIFKLVTVPAQQESDAVLYEQWNKVSGGLQLQADGSVAYSQGALPETAGDAQIPIEAVVLTKDGVVARTDTRMLPDSFLSQRAASVFAGQGGAVVDWHDRNGAPRRVYYEQQALGDQSNQVPVVVVVSRSTAELQATTRRLLLLLAGGGTLVTLVGAALAWLLVERTLRPVRAIAAAARSIGDRDLHRRVDVPTPADELRELRATFNQMLGRLERSFEGMRRFTADASHELRSPLTVIRTAVDVALARPRAPADYQKVLQSVQVEVDHMGRVLEQLLLLAQADAGSLRPLLREIDVPDLVEELAARWRGAAEAKQVEIVAEMPDVGTVQADPDLLRRALDNLVENAVRHSPALAQVTVSARRADGAWLFEVADQGAGIPEDLREEVFRRFVRADSVRTRRGGGAGLGLALGAAIAHAHHGELTLARLPGPGAVFQLRLPALEQPTSGGAAGGETPSPGSAGYSPDSPPREAGFAGTPAAGERPPPPASPGTPPTPHPAKQASRGPGRGGETPLLRLRRVLPRLRGGETPSGRASHLTGKPNIALRSLTRVAHPIFARFYAWTSPSMDRGGVAEHRRRLLAGLSGSVIEVGAGNGLNFAHYPVEVSRVLAVEPERHLRAIAQRNAERAQVPIEVVDGVAEQLPAGDGEFDSAVASLVLCSVPDQQGALAELYRVVRPGGQLRFFEHVRAETPTLARIQGLLDATVWPLFLGGCHASRDTAAAIAKAGFQIERLDRFRFPDGPVALPSSPHILGVASRPSTL